MVSQELVSIIIPVYNSEKYLDACLQSVLAQTYKNIEILLIDDGSTDRSGVICDAYAAKDKRIHVFHNQNHGVSYSRNCGIKFSKGEFLLFIDSDDTINSIYVEDLMKYSRECDLVIAQISDTYEKNHKIIDRVLPKTTKMRLFAQDYWELTSCTYGPCNKLYQREIIVQNQISFVEDISWGEDRLFNFEYYKHIGTYIISPKARYIYYHREEMSLSKQFKYADDLNIMNRILAKYKEFLWGENAKHKEKLLCGHCIDFWMYAGSGYKMFCRRCQFIQQFLKGVYSAQNWKRWLVLKCIQHGWYRIIYVYYRVKWKKQQWRVQ